MAKNNSWTIPLLIGLGLGSILLSLLISSRTEKLKPGIRPLARIELNLGKVSVFRKNMTSKETLAKRTSLFALDSVETGADGDATMDFDSSYRIRVMENSLITLDNESEKTVIIIKRGDVQVENFGREGSVYVSRDGVRWTATEYEMEYKKQAPDGALPDLAPSGSAISPSGKTSTEGLTSDAIQDTLKAHRGNFFRCYTQLLQRTPGVVGQASVSFTIERTGKVSNPEVTSSTLSDPAFKKCLVEATRRVEFKSFVGDAIHTVFPLKFE
jgi:hypothetical protein